LISFLVLFWVLRSNDTTIVLESLAGASYAPFVALALIWGVATLYLEATYFHLSFRWIEGVDNFRQMFRIRAASYVLAIVNPSLGYGGLVAYVRRCFGVKIVRGTVIMLNEALHELGAIGLLAALGALWITSTNPSPPEIIVDVSTFGWGCLGAYLCCVGISRVGERLRLPRSPLALFEEIPLRHYLVYFALKVAQNLVHGLWVVLAMGCFGLEVPLITGIALAQVVRLVRTLPVAAFGIGVDQLVIPLLFAPWVGDAGAGALLAFSLAYTASIGLVRALVGVPFISRVLDDCRQELAYTGGLS